MSNNKNIEYQTIYSSQLYISSSDADIYMNGIYMKSSCVFFFEELLKLTKSAIEMRVSVVNAQFPYSFYNINEFNNYINVNGHDYYFDYGNYNVNSFITMWKTTITNITGSWTVSYNNITNKLLFSTQNAFTFTDNNKKNSIFTMLGFLPNITMSSFTNGSIQSLMSVTVVNFCGPMRLNIKTSSFNISNNYDTSEKGRTMTLASVPVNAPAGGIISYNNFTQFKSIFKNHEISTLQIDIEDENNNPIIFDNKDWTITLQIDIVNEVIHTLDNLDDVYKNQTQEN